MKATAATDRRQPSGLRKTHLHVYYVTLTTEYCFKNYILCSIESDITSSAVVSVAPT